MQEVWPILVASVPGLVCAFPDPVHEPDHELDHDVSRIDIIREKDALIASEIQGRRRGSSSYASHPCTPTARSVQQTPTVRHCTIRSKGCLSNKTALAMVFKLVEAAQKSWRRLDGHNQLPKLIHGVKFTDGIEVAANPASSQPKTAAA